MSSVPIGGGQIRKRVKDTCINIYFVVECGNLVPLKVNKHVCINAVSPNLSLISFSFRTTRPARSWWAKRVKYFPHPPAAALYVPALLHVKPPRRPSSGKSIQTRRSFTTCHRLVLCVKLCWHKRGMHYLYAMHCPTLLCKYLASACVCVHTCVCVLMTAGRAVRYAFTFYLVILDLS